MDDKLSTKYNDAVQQIKTAILRSQAKALAGVNQEQLALYYGMHPNNYFQKQWLI